MANEQVLNEATGPQWPNGTLAAVCLTLDNMGEAADLSRGLWPNHTPVGSHFSVTQILPQILQLLEKYHISATYFVEAWNMHVYGDFITESIHGAGHEIGWHAWQHEPWAKYEGDKDAERINFERSWGREGIDQWVSSGKLEAYRGFRPPGGIINGTTTVNLCREYKLGYVSPAAENAAIVELDTSDDTLVVLPFRWATVDAYYYMDTFAGLRELKGEYGSEPQRPETLVQRYMQEVDNAIQEGGYVSLLFHPFLTTRPERLQALEAVLEYLAAKRDQGVIWLVRCRDVEEYIRRNPSIVGRQPQFDTSSWR